MKLLFLRCARALGLFHLAWLATGGRARILCYHGISIADEHQFRPGLFMRAETFASRLGILGEWKFNHLTLDQFYIARSTRTLPRHALVITVDDGWSGVLTHMLPLLRQHSMTATLYLSTYFVEQQRPVFKVAVSYLFWKHGRGYPVREDSCLRPHTDKTLLTEEEVLELAKRLGAAAESAILQELCHSFGENYQDWIERGLFMFLGAHAVRELANGGVAIELHTHRHRFSETSEKQARDEVRDNRDSIARILPEARPRHFCFPRGEFRTEQLQLLEEEAIATATTTRQGLVSDRDPMLDLPRIVDGERTSQLEFEAEITGFLSLARSLGAAFRLYP